MKIARKYVVSVDVKVLVTLFDKDVEGESEAQISERVLQMAALSTNIKVVRLHVSEDEEGGSMPTE